MGLTDHIRVAMEQHERACRRDYVSLPEGWDALRAIFGPPTEPQMDVGLGPSLLLTYEDASQLLKISERTLQRIVNAGNLAPVNLADRCVRFRRIDVEQYVEKLNGRTEWD